MTKLLQQLRNGVALEGFQLLFLFGQRLLKIEDFDVQLRSLVHQVQQSMADVGGFNRHFIHDAKIVDFARRVLFQVFRDFKLLLFHVRLQLSDVPLLEPSIE